MKIIMNFYLLIATFLGSSLTAYSWIYVSNFLFRQWKFMDEPERFGYDRAPVPYGIGIIFFLNFLLWSPLFFDISFKKTLILLLLGFFITAISFIDDRSRRIPKLSIGPKIRLFLQIFIGIIIAMTSIKIGYISNIFWGMIYLDQWSFTILGTQIFCIPIIFTVLWYVFVFNATNWSDGIPGITSGLSIIIFIILGILSFRLYGLDDTLASKQNSVFVFTIISVLLPTTIIFWSKDFFSRVIIGDSGTMFLGFMIASLAIISGGKVATVVSALGIYLIDAVYVIVSRIFRWQNPMKGDRNSHLHHRLIGLGYSDNFIRILIYSIALISGGISLFLDTIGKIILFWILTGVVLLITPVCRLCKKNHD